MSAKRVWISLPLFTSTDPTDAAVVGFTKGGQKRKLQIETASFITKWLMDKNVPFSIDFESATIGRNLMLEALPRRLQRALGYKVGVASETVVEGEQVENAESDITSDVVADGDQKPEAAAESPAVDAGGGGTEPDNGDVAEDDHVEN